MALRITEITTVSTYTTAPKILASGQALGVTFEIYQRGDMLICQWADGETNAQQLHRGEAALSAALDWRDEILWANTVH